MEEEKNEELDLTRAPIGRTMLNYALPCIISRI